MKQKSVFLWIFINQEEKKNPQKPSDGWNKIYLQEQANR